MHVAAQEKIKFAPSAFRNLDEYDKKWKDYVQKKLKKDWDRPLIHATLLDAAIKIGVKKKVGVIGGEIAQAAIRFTHPKGQMNECFNSGLKIMRNFSTAKTSKLHPDFTSYVEKSHGA